MGNNMSKLKKEQTRAEERLFKKLLKNEFLNKDLAIESLVNKLFKEDKEEKSECLSMEEFYFELINKKSKKGLHPNFIHSLYFIDPKKLYSFFDEEKIKEVFYSETAESVMFLNKMLKHVIEISTEYSNELISCINSVLKIDDDNKKMFDFKAKLYLNILQHLIGNRDEPYSLLKKINTSEKQITSFLCKNLNKETDFDDLNANFRTIKSRIYYYYENIKEHCTISKDGKVLKLEPDERAINIGKTIASNKRFKDYLMKKINSELTFIGSTYPYCVGVTLAFAEIADLTMLNTLKEILNKYNVYNVVKEESFIESYPELVQQLKELDMKIIKEEKKYLNSIVNTDTKKKMNNRL